MIKCESRITLFYIRVIIHIKWADGKQKHTSHEALRIKSLKILTKMQHSITFIWCLHWIRTPKWHGICLAARMSMLTGAYALGSHPCTEINPCPLRIVPTLHMYDRERATKMGSLYYTSDSPMAQWRQCVYTIYDTFPVPSLLSSVLGLGDFVMSPLAPPHF